jgi:hypothetical protein
MSRTSARIIVAITAVVLGASLLVGSSASALEGEGFTLPARGTFEGDYGPIPAPDPATTTANGGVSPADCALLPSCMLVPIDIVVPDDLAPADDFYASITMEFDQPTGQEDLDTFLYDNGQKEEEEGEAEPEPTQIASSASGDNPEVIKAYDPRYGRYNLVLANFAGAGMMVHVKAESVVSAFDKPFESLAPGPNGGTINRNNKPTTTTTRPAPTAATTTTVTVPAGVVIPDDDFEGGAFAPDESEFDLGAATDFAQAGGELPALNPDGDSPSALAVLGWMLLLPLALVAIGFVVLKRTRRSKRREPATAA